MVVRCTFRAGFDLAIVDLKEEYHKGYEEFMSGVLSTSVGLSGTKCDAIDNNLNETSTDTFAYQEQNPHLKCLKQKELC